MSIKSKVQKNVILAPLTTFKIGGAAKYYIEASRKEDFSEAFEWAKEKNEKIFILGGGSNILINDKGVDGLVIKMANDEIKVHGERLECGAGATLSRALSVAVPADLSGLEWSVGIPRATVGGAIWGNAGAFGTSIGEIVEMVEAFNVKKMNFEFFSRKDCEFSYRESFFKRNPNYLIWKVTLKLNPAENVDINRAVNKNIEFRNSRQPKLPSAGSVFKNLSFKDMQSDNPELAQLAEKDEKVKNGMVGAAWIIDEAGLKGKTIGGAKISLEHANFIVNTGGATAEDIIMLISFIKQQVRDKYKIQLHEEVQYIGF